MNYVRIYEDEKTKEQYRLEKLKQYGLDEESIKEFRSKIKKVSKTQSNELGFSLSSKLIRKINKKVIIDLILDGADVNYRREKTPKKNLLELAIKTHDFETAILLIKAGAEFNFYNYNLTPVYIIECIKEKMPELLEILILLGVECNKKDILGSKPLDFAKRFLNESEDEDKENIIKCIKILEKYTTEEFNIVGEFLKQINKPNDKDEKEILEDGIKEMEETLKDCHELLDDNYQKKLKKE